MATELRFGASARLELRGGAGHQVTVKGVATTYGSGYRVSERGREFVETMAPRAAAGVTDGDTRLLLHHNDEVLPLARSPRTLRLEDRSDALHFSAELDRRQSHARDTILSIERGDLTGVSVGMIVAADQWNGDRSQRTITRLASLPEISLVNFPANPAAQVAVAQRWARRAGAVLSAANARRILAAHQHLGAVLESAGLDADKTTDGLDGQEIVSDNDTSTPANRGLSRREREEIGQQIAYLRQCWPNDPAVRFQVAVLERRLRAG